jgi:UrcA family protein
MLKQVIIASFALATVASLPAAALTRPSEISTVTVSVAGIDTHSTSGAQVMLQRIKFAAKKVCGGDSSLSLDRQLKFRPCVNEVTQRTVTGLNNPQLTALLNKTAPDTKVASAH